MNNSDKFCRFCLKEVIGIRLENIEQAVRNMLSVLKLKMDLDISEEPKICVDCVENLQRLYSFKVICIETENRLSPFTNSNIHMQIDMAQVYLKINGNKSLGDINICRFCMCEIPSDISIQLDTVINAMPSIKKLLESFLPEIDLTLVRYPIICKTCHNFLQDYLIFTKNCVNVEEIIMKYIQTEGISPEEKIDLRNVHQFFNKIAIKKEIDQMDVAKHEMQQNDHEILKNEFFNMQIESSSCLATEESKLDIKDENIDLRLTVKVPGRALECTPLKVENIKQEGDEFNETKNIGQICESPAPESCSECILEVESKEDKKYLHILENQFPIMESSKCCKHKTNREYHSQQDMPDSNFTLQIEQKTSFKNDRLGDETVPGDVKTYKCGNKDCSYKTKDKSNFNRHMLIHQGPSKVKMYKCDSENCTFKTKYKDYLSKHSSVHKNLSEVMVYKCENEDCSFETKYKANWICHKLIHKDPSEVKIYRCKNEGCSFVTLHRKSLVHHSVVHEDSADVPIYKCGYDGCLFETKYKTSMPRHKLIHEEVMVYKCVYDGCSFETKHRKSLSRHGLVHKEFSDVTTYKCENEDCCYETKEKGNLVRHRLNHKDLSEVTMHKCEKENCSYQTKHKNSLVNHKLVHKDSSEVTMHKCDKKNCSYQAKRKKSLINHKLVHKDSSEVTMHKCENEGCLFETKHKRNLGLHKKRVHKESLEVTANKRKK